MMTIYCVDVNRTIYTDTGVKTETTDNTYIFEKYEDAQKFSNMVDDVFDKLGMPGMWTSDPYDRKIF